MNYSSKILLTGSSGMVGSVLKGKLENAGYINVLSPSRLELNLLDHSSIDAYFNFHLPEYVFMIAAKVGGIAANIKNPVEFLQDNLVMEIGLFKACFKYKTIKNIFLGSSCIYPKAAIQPITENMLLTGPLEPTNEGYALSKIVGLSLAKYYYNQYKMTTICVIPSNIYGTNDHFDLEKSHVLSALVKRFVDAHDDCTPVVTLWGTGIAKREFIHVADVAEALIYLMKSEYSQPDIINLGTGQDISIKSLANIISDNVGYKGVIEWDSSKPDGMLKKCMNNSKITQLGFTPKIQLLDGIKKTISEYSSQKREEKK
jgi:GDP-L-fucose synthase